MGSKISIDKHVSSLDDILDMSPYYFNKIKFENKIPDNITQHIKIWRFCDEDKKSKNIRTEPISLQNIQTTNFTFLSSECYLVLLVYKKGLEDPASFVNFPHSMWGLVESYSNLTPRGLETPVASSESVGSLNKEVLESFLMPKRNKTASNNSKYEYMLFVWNGKTAGPLTKSLALSTAFDFETFISKAKDPLLQVLFSGGVIRNKKLQKGTILQLNSSANKDPNQDLERQFSAMRETIYLFKFLFPLPAEEGRRGACRNFNQYFLRREESGVTVENNVFIQNSTGKKESSADSDMEQESSKESRPVEPATHRGPVGSLSLGNRLNQQSSNVNDPAHIESRERTSSDNKAPAAKGGKFMIPNLNLAKNLNQNDIGNEPLTRGGMRVGVDVSNADNHHDDQNSKAGLDYVQPKPTKPVEDKQVGAKPKFKIDFTNVKPNIGNESARPDHPGFPKNNGARDDNNKHANDKMIPEHRIAEIPSERGENSEDTEEESSSQEAQTQRGLILGTHRGPFGIRGEPGGLHIKDAGNFERKDLTDITWEQIESLTPEERENMRDSVIREIKIRHFSKMCNEIIPGFLYLGGEESAHNLQTLEANGITHIINSAADVLENKFSNRFKYLTFYQKDSKTDDIECIFYDCLEFIDKCRSENGKVFVHCVQGVSRSVSITIAYLLSKNRLTYDAALEIVKKSRGVANPNIGFILQLMNFQKRLYEPFDSVPYNPRVFCCGSHQLQSPHYIVTRMLIENLYQPKSMIKLDPRAIFILQTEKIIYKWIGNRILEANKAEYEKAADLHIKRLQTYERGAKDVQKIKCGEEPESFWRLWGDSLPDDKYMENKDWNNWFLDLSKTTDTVGITYKRYEEDDGSEEEARKKKATFYVYPSYSPIRIFEFEDLSSGSLVLACRELEGEKYCYYWRGGEFGDVEEADLDEDTFYENVIMQHWNITPESVIRIEEIPGDESEEFEDIVNL